MAENQYTEDNIRSLDWKEHIRLRPGMYIGKLFIQSKQRPNYLIRSTNYK